MLPQMHFELAQATQREYHRQAMHRHLINIALSGWNTERNSTIPARLGEWLVKRGRAIEARYTVEPVPVRYMR